MARSETRLNENVWQKLHDVSPEAKPLYIVLLTETTVNNAGLGILRLGLWSRRSGLDRKACAAALAELAAHELITVDHHTEEILIHDFISGQGVDREPNKLIGAIRTAGGSNSTILRTRFMESLDDLAPVVRGQPKTCKARREFQNSSIRKRLRREIAAGVHCCGECGSTDELVIDHIHPLAAGGSNDPENLGRKGARTR